MQRMGLADGDEYGHLIARSLGGNSSPLNIVPMAKSINRHCRVGDQNSIDLNVNVNPYGLTTRDNLKSMDYGWRTHRLHHRCTI